MIEKSPAGLILPSSDDVACPGSKAEVGVGVDPWMGSDRGSEESSRRGHRVVAKAADPSKTRSPRMVASHSKH